MTQRRRFRVKGRVQAVGFRAWTIHHGRELRLRGTVKNLPDGSVEVDAEGEASALDQLLEALRQGPPMSVVTEVEELAVGAAPLPDAFRVAF